MDSLRYLCYKERKNGCDLNDVNLCCQPGQGPVMPTADQSNMRDNL